MSDFVLNIKNRIMQKPIIVLSWASLVLIALSCIMYFVFFDFYGFLVNFIRMLFLLPPYILFTIYLTKFYKELKYPVMLPVTIGLLALYPLVSFIFPFVGRGSIVNLLFIISSILAIISTLKGISKKLYIIVAMSLGILREIAAIEMIIGWYGAGSHLFPCVCEILGSISIYVALLLFGIKNKIPTILVGTYRKKNDEKYSPEQSLKLLKDKLELGMITEEEYQTQRAEIISKL